MLSIERQVCNPELSKQLKQLRFNKNSYFVWVLNRALNRYWLKIRDVIHFSGEVLPTYTSTELGHVLKLIIEEKPYEIITTFNILAKEWECQLFDKNGELLEFKQALDEADARAEMLIYLHNQKRINLSEV